MGLLDELKRLAHPYSEEEEDFDDFIPNRSGHTTPASESEHRSKVVTIPTTTQLQVVLVKPERFDNAPEIADHLREKRTVVLNLESANKEIARRLVDFLSGVAYAQDGKIKRVANSTYIITPYNVDIMGDLIDELENNGLYF
ncbi:MAG: cell division protein SepF [Oscillospiraceae bacterium]|jgi:cell division inhibitor SepF|nr:cell division protein SepF [Oscillospiraceae bacterium]